MKRKELAELYEIKKIEKNPIKLFKSFNFDRSLLFPIIIYALFSITSNYINYYFQETKFDELITIISSFIGLLFTAYLVISTLENKSDSKKTDILNMAICKVKPQLFTIIAEGIFAIPVALLIVFLSMIPLLIVMTFTDIPITYENNLFIGYIIGGLIFLSLMRYFFSTYICIIHDVEGFDAVKLSTMFFKNNILLNIIIYILFWGFIFLNYYLGMMMSNTVFLIIKVVLSSIISSVFIIFLSKIIMSGMIFTGGEKDSCLYDVVE
ncbi:MAG: hypothetical protein PQJ44_06535 [Sphaerochaetaceae bacterium]|nr:hypothetical protein [Sphaerochaetaceae bacterium]